MAHIDSSIPRSRLPRPSLTNLPGITRIGSHQTHLISSTLGLGSGLSQDIGSLPIPSREKSAMIFYSSRTGTTLAYAEAMLSELSHKYTHNTWNFGVILGDNTLPHHCRVRINGEPVDESQFKKFSHDYEIEVKARFSHTSASLNRAIDGLDAMLVNVALRIFDKQNVTTIAVSVASSSDKTGKSSSNSNNKEHIKDSEPTLDTVWSIERLIVELYQPKTVICGFEPLPTYEESLPDSWRSGLIYLMRHSIHVISAAQPNLVRIQLHSLAKAFGVTIELSQTLLSIPACKDTKLGIFGSKQHHYAALALSACQAWAYKHKLLRTRTQKQSFGSYSTSGTMSPMRAGTKQVPQSPFVTQIQNGLRDTPSWMLRGLGMARSTGQFYTAPTDEQSQANWHFSWAVTPGDFSQTGEWFNNIISGSDSPRILLIHLPESFIKTVRFRRESDGQWQESDYRDMLGALYAPLREVQWTCCVFAADILNESHVIESSVPPVLSQYVLREFWTQLSGVHTDQVFIAPSLGSALRLIESKCATRMVTTGGRIPVGSSPKAGSPGLGSRSMFFEPSRASPTLKPTQLLRPSPSSSNLLANSSRGGRTFSKAAMKSSASIDNFSEGRRKMSFGLGNDSTASLPTRTPRINAPLPPPPASAIHHSNMDILVTGSRSFIQSTLEITQKQ